MDMWIYIVGGIIIVGALIVRLIEKKTGVSFDPHNIGDPVVPMSHHTDRHGTSDTISPDHFSRS